MAILDGKLDVTTQEGYDIACALRGPDLTTLESLKKVLVGRLRNLMGASPGVYMFSTPESRLRSVKDAQEEWEDFSEWLAGIEDHLTQYRVREAINHWAWHLVVAYKALLVVEPTNEELELLLAIARALPGEGVMKALEAYADYVEEQQ